MKINSITDLEAIRAEFQAKEKEFPFTAHICYGAGCLSSDCKDFKEAFLKELESENLQNKVKINLTGCLGACTLGPTLVINPGNILYCNLNPASAVQIVKEHIRKGKIADKFCYRDPETGKVIPTLDNIPFFRHQKKSCLKSVELLIIPLLMSTSLMMDILP